jgi:hypothetical protein
MAKKLGELQYVLKTSSAANATTGTSTLTLSEGQQTTVQDSVVKVKTISETVGACTVAAGQAACTADKGTMAAELSTGGTSGEFATRYALADTDRLAVLDSEAPAAESLILVGGQLVNTITAQTLQGTDVRIDRAGVKVVKEIGNRIVVAGYTAEDTSAAAAQFISELLAKA